MTVQGTKLSLTDALQAVQGKQPEELRELPNKKLEEYLEVFQSSKQKRPRMLADLIGGILSAKKKEEKKKAEPERELVENSIKTPQKEVEAGEKQVSAGNKAADKPKRTRKARQTTKAVEATPETDEKEEVKEKPKRTRARKNKTEEQPEAEAQPINYDDMTREELLELAKKAQTQTREMFPTVIEGKGMKLERIHSLDTQGVQSLLREDPFTLYVLLNEAQGQTTFIVLYMNEDVTVLLDKTQQINETVSISTSDIKEKTIKDGQVSLPFSYYRRTK